MSLLNKAWLNQFGRLMERESSPLIRLPTTEGDIELHWDNCLIRTFDDDQYDHIELREEDGLKGLRVGQYIMDILLIGTTVSKLE